MVQRHESAAPKLGPAARRIALIVAGGLGGEAAVSLADFHAAFFIFALVTLGATLMSARLPRDAGAELSGHALAGERAPAPQS